MDEVLSYQPQDRPLTGGWASTVTLPANKAEALVAKRTPVGGPAKSLRPTDTKLAAQPESHSGEGAASVLETLHKLEKRRLSAAADQPGPRDEPEASKG
jgi:hypothetical protein